MPGEKRYLRQASSPQYETQIMKIVSSIFSTTRT